MILALAILIAYLIGSIPTAYILGRLVKNIDIREHGSGNVGATNVFRVVGKRWGITALVLDILKGYLPVVLLAPWVADLFEVSLYANFVIGVVAVCGHNWTIFLKFKGGKGVATTAGVVMALFPKAFALAILVFAVVFYFSRYVSLGSIVAAIVFPVNLVLFYHGDAGFIAGLVFSLFLAGFIVFRHKANIVRLMNGTENKIQFSKKS